MFQMAIKYHNIVHSNALQILTKLGIFGLKTNHLATLLLGQVRLVSDVYILLSTIWMSIFWRSVNWFYNLMVGNFDVDKRK
jgi:hypothetical protein